MCILNLENTLSCCLQLLIAKEDFKQANNGVVDVNIYMQGKDDPICNLETKVDRTHFVFKNAKGIVSQKKSKYTRVDSKEWITRNPEINVNPHQKLMNIEDCFLCNPNFQDDYSMGNTMNLTSQGSQPGDLEEIEDSSLCTDRCQSNVVTNIHKKDDCSNVSNESQKNGSLSKEEDVEGNEDMLEQKSQIEVPLKKDFPDVADAGKNDDNMPIQPKGQLSKENAHDQNFAFEQDTSKPKEKKFIPDIPEAGSSTIPDVKIDEPQEVTNEGMTHLGNFFKGCMIL